MARDLIGPERGRTPIGSPHSTCRAMTASSASLDTLLTWIRTESPTRDTAGVNRMMDLVVAHVREAPIAVERIPGQQGLGDALVLRAGPQTEEASILVMSHLDTVHPVGTIEHDL